MDITQRVLDMVNAEGKGTPEKKANSGKKGEGGGK
jgi:hypothetical protein